MLNLHPGNMLASLSDVQRRTHEIVEKKAWHVLRYHGCGHEANIMRSMRGSRAAGEEETRSYVSDATLCFAAVREAVDNGEKVAV